MSRKENPTESPVGVSELVMQDAWELESCKNGIAEASSNDRSGASPTSAVLAANRGPRNVGSITAVLVSRRGRFHGVLLLEWRQAGYSSVGRASDCRALQLSDGPWFDSGWPDFAYARRALARRPAWKR